MFVFNCICLAAFSVLDAVHSVVIYRKKWRRLEFLVGGLLSHKHIPCHEWFALLLFTSMADLTTISWTGIAVSKFDH